MNAISEEAGDAARRNVPLVPDRTPRLLGVGVALVSAVALGGILYAELGGADFTGLSTLLRMVDLDEERSLGTWYNSALLLAAAAGFWIIGVAERSRQRPFARHWAVLGMGFLIMSLDEVAASHERAGVVGGRQFDLPVFSWIIPGSLLVVVLAFVFRRFLSDLPPASRRRFLVAGFVYLLGAVGLEAIGWAASVNLGEETMGYRLITWVEETLELSGAVLVIHALIAHARTRGVQPVVRIPAGVPPAERRA